ncbi:unnamed protein product [Musa banksii]
MPDGQNLKVPCHHHWLQKHEEHQEQCGGTKAKASDCHLSLFSFPFPPIPHPPLLSPMAESRMVELSSPTTNLQKPRDPLCSLLSEME